MLAAALIVNIIVLVPISFGLITNAKWVALEYGPKEPARGILLAIYLTILFGSGFLLLMPSPAATITLLSLQVAYKLLSPLTVGSFRNKVVASNLAIATFHLVALVSNSAVFS